MTLTTGRQITVPKLDEYLEGSSRLIGMGVEVHDVTAVLNKQGTISTFLQPQSTVEPETFTVTGIIQLDPIVNVEPTAVSMFLIKKFPKTLGHVMLLEGSRQWEAKEGCYAVVPFHGRDNFPGQPIYKTPGMYVDESGGEIVGTNNVSQLMLGQYATPPANFSCIQYLCNKFAPVDSKGILITGQSVNSKFIVNLIFYLENFPATDDLKLVPLARPSACEDQMALTLISCATKELPIAVPVRDNGLGDWFAEIVATIAPIVGTFATGLGGPFGAPITVASTAASAAAKAYMDSGSYKNTGGFFAPARSKKPKPKNKQVQPPSVDAGAKPAAIRKAMNKRAATDQAIASVLQRQAAAESRSSRGRGKGRK